jgi:hypothetical protein
MLKISMFKTVLDINLSKFGIYLLLFPNSVFTESGLLFGAFRLHITTKFP